MVFLNVDIYSPDLYQADSISESSMIELVANLPKKQPIMLKDDERVLVPTGIGVSLRNGYIGLILPVPDAHNDFEIAGTLSVVTNDVTTEITVPVRKSLKSSQSVICRGDVIGHLLIINTPYVNFMPSGKVVEELI